VDNPHGNPVLSIEVESVDARIVQFTLIVQSHIAEEKCVSCRRYLRKYIKNDLPKIIRAKLKRYIGIGKKLGAVYHDVIFDNTVIRGSIDIISPLKSCPLNSPVIYREHNFGSADIFKVLDDGRLYLLCENCQAMKAYPAPYSDRLLMRTRSRHYWKDDYVYAPFLLKTIGCVPSLILHSDLDTYVAESVAIPSLSDLHAVFLADEYLQFDLVHYDFDLLYQLLDLVIYDPAF